MMEIVFAINHELEIFYSIVMSIAIDMMNVLVGRKWPTEVSLHYAPVLQALT